jgi:peptidoglycan/xylan/chitin deacetylase (PgdA/CDA1 family)
MSFVKRAFKQVITLPGTATLFRPLLRDCGVIFMLHRFSVPELGIVGDDPNWLRACLAYLRRERRELISLTEMFARLEGGHPLRGAIAFTIDDGYREQALVGGAAFAEFDCPATIFATSGFVDGQLWFWWDKIEYVFTNAAARSASIKLGDRSITVDFGNPTARQLGQTVFTDACKRVPDDMKHAAIQELASQAEVEVPVSPPDRYAPVSWNEARASEVRGITFGPHTVTHPVLARTTSEQSSREIEEGWKRIQAEMRNPVPIFCYPNGQADDFGPREIATLEQLGFKGAVVGTAGYATRETFLASADERFRVRRFGLPADFPDLLQFVTGVERMKQLVRAGRN